MKKLIIYYTTALGFGLIPFAPGTFGTLFALIVYLVIGYIFPQQVHYIMPIVALVLLLPSVKLCDRAESIFAEKDPQKVVIDEVLGFFVAVSFQTFSWQLALAAFILFRFFDILKPFPINNLQKIKAGWGIIIDDLIAGLYANLVIVVLVIQKIYTGVNIF